MASPGFSWMLQFYLLLLLVHPLDPRSRPERNTGASHLTPEELEQQDEDPEPAPWVNMKLVAWTCFLVELLIIGTVLACYLVRRLLRWRREKRQSPSARARRSCCPKGRCPKKLMQLLRHNRAMLRLCLRYCPQERPRARTAAKGLIWKRRRLQISPQC